MTLNEVTTTEVKRKRYSDRFENPLLEMDIDCNNDVKPEISKEESKRQLRRRSQRFIRPPIVEPKRRSFKIEEFDELDNIKQIYLDKTVKRLPPALETIFEEPMRKRNETLFWSSRKYRRFFNFEESAKNKTKLRKRSMKAEAINTRVSTTIKKKGKKKITIEYVKKYIDSIED